MTPEEEAVARLYDDRLFAYETERLDVHWVEFGMTLRSLERWVPGDSGYSGPPIRSPGGVAVEIGVGSGAYSSWLAARGFDLHLVDISGRMLEAAQARLARERRAGKVLGIHQASATDVSALADETADLLLEMGPLYHLREPRDRRQCVREAFRLLKPGGLIFAAGVNRMAYLAYLVKQQPDQGAARRNQLLGLLRDGNIDDFGQGSSLLPPAEREAYGHLTTPAEFSAEFRDGFEQIALLGLESFVGTQESSLPEVSQSDRDAWLDIVEETAHLPDGLGCSSHFLYVGRRAAKWNDG